MTAFLGFVVALAVVAIWHDTTWRRALFYWVACAALVVAMLVERGLPRPSWTFARIPSGVVEAEVSDEPKAIYLWVLVDGHAAPLALRLPWSEEEAAQVQTLLQTAAQQQQSSVRIQPGNARGRPDFYADGPPPLPAKGR